MARSSAQTGADLLEIIPETPYSENYNTVVDQAKDEIRHGYHPTIKKDNVDLNSYDTVYLGSPIWWGTMAPPVMNFLSENDLDGKTILPFTTHGGGGRGAEQEIAAWIKQNQLD